MLLDVIRPAQIRYKKEVSSQLTSKKTPTHMDKHNKIDKENTPPNKKHHHGENLATT